jgi:hypothetical protein
MPPKKKNNKTSNNDSNDNNEIINFYELPKVQKFLTKSINPNYDKGTKHGIKVPFRGILTAASGGGKTNLLFNVILQMANTFNHIYIYTQAEEPLYEYIESQISSDLLTIKYGIKALQDFDEKEYYGQSLVVLDDMVNEKEKDQACIKELYLRGRKIAGGVSLLYLTQKYHAVPKFIRGQCQYFFIIKVSEVDDLKRILKEFALSATNKQMDAMYEYCCESGKFGNCMIIDLMSGRSKMFRKNFKEILNPKDFS